MSENPQQLEDELEAAMAVLDTPLPETTLDIDSSSSSQGEGSPASPTLEGLDESRRLKIKTACEACPNSVWFASPDEVKCYCRVMFLITWSNKETNQITACDGMFLGQE
jgi:hypothetical protein